MDFEQDALTIEESDIKGQGCIGHPEGHAPGARIGEEHAVVFIEDLPMHEAPLLLRGGKGDLHLDGNLPDRQWQPGFKGDRRRAGFILTAGQKHHCQKEEGNGIAQHRLVVFTKLPWKNNFKFMPKKKSSSGEREVLLYADSEKDADMLYFSGVMVPDPFLAFSCRGRRIGVVSRLEFGRVSRESQLDEVLSLEAVTAAAKKAQGGPFHEPASLVKWLARHFDIPGFRVSGDFPCGTAFRIREMGLPLEVVEGLLLPERERKTDEEAAQIRKGNAVASAGFRVVEKILRRAEIRRDWLYLDGRRLTSERLQEAVAMECLKHGAVTSHIIAAGGDQACDPHCVGSGPLRARELIIVDIFPKLMKSGFHGDMTRTYLKGRASEAQKKLYQTVLEAEQWALGEHRSGKSGSLIYRKVVERFEAAGYRTGEEGGVPVGFIHGLGHGLGLAVHEPPRVNRAGSRLKSGQVITVEPGLYYPGLGGVRVEDVVRVGAKEPEMLSKHPYRWQIR